MFGLGMSEVIALGVLALILIGPKQLPEVARTLGRFINDLKRSTEGITEDLKRQAKIDLDIDADFLGNKNESEYNKISPPIPIMRDPRTQNLPTAESSAEEKKTEKADIKIEPPEQMTFTFDPNRPADLPENSTNSVLTSQEKDIEKKD